MDSAIVSTALDNAKKFWKSDELENDEIDQLLDSIPELSVSFEITKRVGHGAFSAVYLAHHKENGRVPGSRTFAIKHIIPTSHPSRILMELKCLKTMGGRDNIIEVVSCLRHQNHIVMIMPYFPHDPFSEYVGKLAVNELRAYLYNLFIALKRVHQFNIIHRDVKPSNFLFSRKYQRYALIDFGLAQEVSQTPQTKAKETLSGSISAPLTETPLMNASRIVKRKLSIPLSYEMNSKFESPQIQAAHISKYSSPSLPSINWAYQQMPRRSPRKLQSPMAKSPHKENLCLPITPKKACPVTSNIHDSPSKHTRLAEAAMKNIEDCSDNNFLGFGNSPKDKKIGIKRKRDALLQKNDPAKPHPKLKRVDTNSTLHQIKMKSGQNVLCPTSCKCYGSSRLCSVCLARKNQQAPRAGTPGFRAPEVLMRHPRQTTAVDMWAAGVILLCLLSGRYPFFQAVDDLSSLSEITTIFGTQALKKAAAKIDKLFTTTETKPSLDLKKICEKLRLNLGLPKAHHATSLECPNCRQTRSDCICRDSPKQISDLPLDLSKNSIYGKAKPTLEISPLQGCQAGKPMSSPKTRGVYPDSAYHLLSRLLDLNPSTRISAEDALRHPFITCVEES